MSSLDRKLTAALESREARCIRRRLPSPVSTQPSLDFASNDYLSLATSPSLAQSVLAALSSATPHILGATGSRLLVPAPAHAALEARIATFFGAPCALLFNSGFDANVGFFSTVPQPGDVVLFDAYVHASVHDGLRTSRLASEALVSFTHNSVPALRAALHRLVAQRSDIRVGKSNIFVAVESLYSMDGTFAPLVEIVECVEEILPHGNGYVVVDEAHSTGIYGPQGRGMVAALGLEKRIFARLHTFGKALGASGAVLLVSELVRDYLLNYARSFIYTTACPTANIIAIGCSFDLLENGTTELLSARLLDLCKYFVTHLQLHLQDVPPSLLRLPDHLNPATFKPPPDLHPQLGSRHSSQASSWTPWDPDEHENHITSFHTNSHRAHHVPQPTLTRTPAIMQDSTKESQRSPQFLFPPSSPIIPLLTPEPRSLSNFLLSFVDSSTSATATESARTQSLGETCMSSSGSAAAPLATSTSMSVLAAMSVPPTAVPTAPTAQCLSVSKCPVIIHTKPIFPPTVPPGTARVRVCLHAEHTERDVDLLIRGIVAWATDRIQEIRKTQEKERRRAGEEGVRVLMSARL